MKGFENIVAAFFREHHLAKHHIDSFDRFIDERLQAVITEAGNITPEIMPEGVSEYKLKFGQVRIGTPSVREADGSRERIYPSDARIRDVTYAAPMYLEIITEIDGIKKDPIDVEIGIMPIMVRSKHCLLYHLDKNQLITAGEDPQDPGGYFIINGTERILIAIEDLRPNIPILELKTKGPVRELARLFSETPGVRVPHLFERVSDGTIRASFARISRIPITLLMMALGIESDEKIMHAISHDAQFDEDLMANVEGLNEELQTKDDALDWIGRQMKMGQGREYRIERVAELIDHYLLPHIGRLSSNRLEKATYLGKVAEKLIKLHHGVINPDDKDHYANKRLKLAGELMEQLFRASFRGLLNDIKYSFERTTKRGKAPPISTIVRSQLLTSRLESALATGYWVGRRTGVSQHLQRLNHMDTLSHLRRVLSPLTTSQPHFAARELHPTHWGKLCASETPEGQNIGLRKNLAMTAKVTYGFDSEPVRKALFQLGVENWGE